jgi:hypothetical protein
MYSGLIDFESQSRVSFTLIYTGLIFGFILAVYLLIKLIKYLNDRNLKQRLLTPKALSFTKFDRYLNMAAIVFVIIFLNRIPSAKEDSFGLTGLYYFVLLVAAIIFSAIPWEKRMAQRQKIAPFFILVAITVLLIQPVLLILKSFLVQ